MSFKLKVQEIKNRVAAALNLELIADGFDYKKTANEFTRTKGDYTHYFSIDILSWSDHYSIDIRLYISQKKIEDFLEKILGKQRHRMTLGGEIADIKFSPDGKKVVHNTLGIIVIFEEDIAAAAESLLHYYVDIAKPFFEKYKDLESIEDIFNGEPYNNVPAYISGNYDTRCVKGLIAAKIVGNTLYNQLVKAYDEEMEVTFKDVRQDAIDNYNIVRDYLEIHGLPLSGNKKAKG